jgi:plastocyanin
MKKALVLALSVLFVTLTAAGAAFASQQPDNGDTITVETRGDTDFIANKLVFSTLAFYPGEIQVRQGDTISFVFADEALEPHTATVLNEEDMPNTIEEVFGCAPCNAINESHFPAEEPEGDAPPQDGAVKVVNQGEQGFDTAGDSLLFFQGETIETTVSAPPGTTLHYLCIIHPWMQGTITVMSEPEETPTATPTP